MRTFADKTVVKYVVEYLIHVSWGPKSERWILKSDRREWQKETWIRKYYRWFQKNITVPKETLSSSCRNGHNKISQNKRIQTVGEAIAICEL
ncbi:hypothetical protein L1987_35269 [Smallanthus sonchifolius]|uniref:Uncharacterized protein n=1 Tax=Smallanthus sonchifolius TaxID=185202 RepID=A0ACB9HWY3_9ASTR|nr:hypothetical protein L1987_35269 [Smallanthus sonchifolius]